MTFVGHFREWVKRTNLFYEMHQFLASLHLGKIMSFFFYCSNLRICFVFCYIICSEFIKLSASVFGKGFATLIDISYGSVILLFRWLFRAYSNAQWHRLRTSNSQTFGLGQTTCTDKFWAIWVIFGRF